MTDHDPIVDLLMLLEAQASVAMSHDPDCQTFTLEDDALRAGSADD